ISIITTFESGMDWSPVFDPVVGHHGKADSTLFWKVVFVDLRNFLHRYNLQKIYDKNYFLVKDVVYNTAYGLDLQAMHELCVLVADERAAQYRQRYVRLVRRMLDIMYDTDKKAF